MRTHNVGVLVATGRGLSPTAGDDSQIDRQSGSDLVEALRQIGVPAVALAVDDDLDLTLRRAPVDACLLATHGVRGGLGQLQALLELRGVPFAGPSAQVTGLAYDKLRARQILGYHSLPVPATLALGGGERPTRHALGLLGWPCVVKPRRGSHAAGVRVLPDAAAVIAEVDAHAGGELLLERAVFGREIEVVLLHGRALGAMEVERDLDAGGRFCAMTTPPRLPRSLFKGICNLAEHAGRALGLVRGVARVDILVHPRHNEVILEAEPLPPLHRDGVVARVALAAGMRYETLVAEHLRGVIELPRPTLPAPEARYAEVAEAAAPALQ